MDRKQNIRTASIRRVGANFDFNGNPIDQNDGGGVIHFSGSMAFYPCGCQKVGNIGTCSCLTF
jgi:hypothetical protein